MSESGTITRLQPSPYPIDAVDDLVTLYLFCSSNKEVGTFLAECAVAGFTHYQTAPGGWDSRGVWQASGFTLFFRKTT